MDEQIDGRRAKWVAAHEQRLALPGLALMTSMFNTTSALGHDRDGTQAVAAALDSVAVLK